jgi:hypothetical protein
MKDEKKQKYIGCRLDEVTFTFSQEANCMSNDDAEIIEITAKSDLGDIGNETFFVTIKTEEWAVDNVKEFKLLFRKIEEAVKLFNNKNEDE